MTDEHRRTGIEQKYARLGRATARLIDPIAVFPNWRAEPGGRSSRPPARPWKAKARRLPKCSSLIRVVALASGTTLIKLEHFGSRRALAFQGRAGGREERPPGSALQFGNTAMGSISRAVARPSLAYFCSIPVLRCSSVIGGFRPGFGEGQATDALHSERHH